MSRGLTVTDMIQTAPWADRIGVFVIQSMPLLRRGIESALREAPAFSQALIRSFPTAEAAASALQDARAGDVILADMPAWTVLRPAGTGGNKSAFAFLSDKKVAFGLVTSVDPAALRLFREQGVSGFMAPEAEAEALVQLVTALSEGRSFYPPAASPKRADVLASLSNRQFQILELMTRGLLNKQIAWELGLTEGTVKSHVSAILDKLGCDRRTQAITAYMKSTGLAAVPAMTM
ncbi:response regulator transcription factor [Methyloferula stellata]|uniref:response regulator transcription factor n=1 Tax=Methyloferula stellata TaxID=876270 RepID=UPI00036E091E|nr:response regulator transcription factor [Methyloferula stellata]